jgi:hypothetical protein
MTRFAFASLLLGAAVTCTAELSAAQTPAAPTAPAAQAGGAAELYHVHFVKAAPGKLLEMVEAYVNAPRDPQSPAPPVILRHRQGDDWNLMVLRPLGAEATLRAAAPPPAELQQFLTRTRPLRAQHNDTFAIGPPWSEAQKLVLGEGGAEPSGATRAVYIVTVFRSLPGHRDELEGVLRKTAAEESGRTLTLQHLEGAPWEFITITRYDSWAALGESEQKQSGQGTVSPLGLAIQEHVAEHHDTVAERVTRVPARQP